MRKNDRAMVQAAAKRLAEASGVPVEVAMDTLLQVAGGLAPQVWLHHHRWPLTPIDTDCLLVHDTLV